jgi:hypothetical protein
MWNLVVNQESERYFIKSIDEENNYFYFVKEDESLIGNKTIQELKDGEFRIVGEATDSENYKYNNMIEEVC